MVPAVLGSKYPSAASHHALFLLCGLLNFVSSNTIIPSLAQPHNRSETDLEALLCFKHGIRTDSTGVLNSWNNISLNFCRWQGVTCGRTLPSHVVSLNLSSVGLGGELRPCMANLSSLVQLDLSRNDFSGSIPDELGALPGLQTLMLAGNSLAGNVPVSLGTAASLSYVNLANNSLSGVIPVSLGTAASLSYVNLANNSLSGVIPDSFASSSSFRRIILSRNSLSGVIPANLFSSSPKLIHVDLQWNALSGVIPPMQKMEALRFLGLTGNLLFGSIPPSLGNVSSLSYILLAQNNLDGSIPETLGQIPNLHSLDLSNNRLRGYVPAKLYNVSSLRFFGLSNNRIVGQIPTEIGRSLPNLQTLIMRGNRFHGLIPTSLANATKLQALDLSGNYLSGSVPSLGSLSYLNQLVLGSNTLEAGDWAFLSSLTNCSGLLRLLMDGNNLTGSLPKSVGNLSTTLEWLNFGGNQISGIIPAEIGNCVNLVLLDMDQNMLSGLIPSTIWNLSNLFVLDLSRNKLSGQISSAIGDLLQLSKLYLDDNNLYGNIPASIGQCKKLLMVNLSFNNLDRSIPSELLSISSLSLGLDLSNNNLTGPIPQQVGALINLVLLNVSNNKLSGEIPFALGQCVQLLSLHVEGNMFSGTIPHSFSTLKSIQQIDLSENNFSGQVPEMFENFTSLDHLNISYNKFEGPIPTGGIFRNSNAVILEGNKGLCEIGAIFALPICPTTSVTKRRSNARLLLIVIPPVTIALFSFLCVVITVMKGSPSQPSQNYRETMKKVSYGDILKATNWLSPVNRISSSHTSSVYIGRFQFDTDLVAIKVFHLNEQGSHNSFFTECEVLKHTRHRNLVQAITLCSTVDFENNEFKAVVYEFMANGSLDMWVHPRLRQGSPRRALSLGQRISIAADVAYALDYLHNQLIPPLIHCDLKPNNVLLDYDMTSRVGDFGSAKFLSSSLSRPEGLVGVGGTIGYIAPEYGMGCKISTGGDVYSFGVLLLEMLTAKRPTDALFCNGLSLQKYVDLAFPDRIGEVLDHHMSYEEDAVIVSLRMQNYIIPLVEIGLMCSMESPKDRPGMRDVCAKIVAIKEAFVETL